MMMATALLAGCGQKGPLQRPADVAAAAAAASAAASSSTSRPTVPRTSP